MRTVVCCGEGWATGWLPFVVDGCEREGVERPALVACAQETEHWQKMPRERRADKHVADFTAHASQGNFETWGQPRFRMKLNLDMARANERTLRLVTTFRSSYFLFATPPWSTAFV
jgi:hypothetical protein